MMATQVMLDEQSLEQLVEAVEARQAAEEDNEEAAFNELIMELADIRAEPFVDEEFMREDEFACRSCNMILHRSRLADRSRLICEDCS
jgi:formamidopyrimidine-DNA glycosylase